MNETLTITEILRNVAKAGEKCYSGAMISTLAERPDNLSLEDCARVLQDQGFEHFPTKEDGAGFSIWVHTTMWVFMGLSDNINIVVAADTQEAFQAELDLLAEVYGPCPEMPFVVCYFCEDCEEIHELPPLSRPRAEAAPESASFTRMDNSVFADLLAAAASQLPN